MSRISSRIVSGTAVITVCLLSLTAPILGQKAQNAKPPDGDEDLVRVYSDLVQTDVMVFDKQGRFVNSLKQGDFELRVEGKPQPIQFFERVTSGSTDEEAQLAAARGKPSLSNQPARSRPAPLDRGRMVFFYLDDLHLSAANLPSTRKVLLHFIDNDMGQNDQAAITSASGQIGFLQQLTDNKVVLRAAVERLKFRSYYVRDLQRPPMTEYQALQIDHYDRELISYFVDEIRREFPGSSRDQAEAQVRSRAHQILTQAASITTNSLSGLEGLVRSMSRLPGRKLLFFISDGFFLDERNSDAHERLRSVTGAAARSGVVIYSLDSRGLVASLIDASSEVAFDPSGRVARSSTGELPASQDAMNALARDTGGRPVFNTNALAVELTKALQETSVYYLLAWRPDHESQTGGKLRRASVSVLGHPDLTVRVRQGFFGPEPRVKANRSEHNGTATQSKGAEVELREAIRSAYPEEGLPVFLSLNYYKTSDRGLRLTASMELSTGSLAFTTEEGKPKAVVDIGGVVYNDQGKAGASFADQLKITSIATEPSEKIVYNYQLYLAPGLYQVRVGARDGKAGRIGTADQWVQIPDLSSHPLALSSLIAGESNPQPAPGATDDNRKAITNSAFQVNHRFHRNSFLRFLIYVYNAARSPSDLRPDVALQVQVLRDQQPVITTPLKMISTEGVADLDQLPYAADVPLAGLPPGRYLLQVTTIDRVSKRSVSQQLRFEVE